MDIKEFFAFFPPKCNLQIINICSHWLIQAMYSMLKCHLQILLSFLFSRTKKNQSSLLYFSKLLELPLYKWKALLIWEEPFYVLAAFYLSPLVILSFFSTSMGLIFSLSYKIYTIYIIIFCSMKIKLVFRKRFPSSSLIVYIFHIQIKHVVLHWSKLCNILTWTRPLPSIHTFIMPKLFSFRKYYHIWIL